MAKQEASQVTYKARPQKLALPTVIQEICSLLVIAVGGSITVDVVLIATGRKIVLIGLAIASSESVVELGGGCVAVLEPWTVGHCWLRGRNTFISDQISKAILWNFFIWVLARGTEASLVNGSQCVLLVLVHRAADPSVRPSLGGKPVGLVDL